VTVDGIIDYLARPRLVFYHGGQGQAAIAVAGHVLSQVVGETSKKEGNKLKAPASGIIRRTINYLTVARMRE